MVCEEIIKCLGFTYLDWHIENTCSVLELSVLTGRMKVLM